MADKGNVDFVRVSKSALSTANSQQVEALWRASDCWQWSNSGGRTIVNIVNKSEGDAGLQKFLAFENLRIQ